MPNRDVIVFGGSAGASSSLKVILSRVRSDLDAAVFVVLHVDPAFGDLTAKNIGLESALPVEIVRAETSIQRARVYFPQPDHHLVLKEGHALVTRGPHENLWRPAIDVLFRSAAVTYGSRVIAVLLSGDLDDGTAGMAAVKTCGGLTVIQDPAEALRSEMLETAAAHVAIDHQVTIAQVPALLESLTRTTAPGAAPPPRQLVEESAFADPLYRRQHPEHHAEPLSFFSCPECSGPLWETKDAGTRFRCLVGHSFHSDSLLRGANVELERTLWAAVRLFEQRMHLERRMAGEEANKGRELRSKLYRERSAESERHVLMLRDLLRGARRDL